MKRITKKYNLNDISMICWFFDKKFCIIVCEDDVVKTPHFHIVDRKTMGNEFDCSISIKSCRYIKTKNILNENQIRKLGRLFKRTFTLKEYGTYWNWLNLCWSCSNRHQIDTYRKITSYVNLNS